MGAAGKTAVKMDRGIDFTEQCKESMVNNYHKLLTKYNDGKSVIVANNVYVMKIYDLQDNFLKALSENFLSVPKNMDFVNANEAAKSINNWVESNTDSKIKNLILPNTLSHDTRLTFVSAIHFKREWAIMFQNNVPYPEISTPTKHSPLRYPL